MSDESTARQQKRSALRDAGIDPYPERFETSHSIVEAISLEDETAGVSMAGRVVSLRVMGKLIFGHLASAEGQIQFALQKQKLNERFEQFRKFVDLADHLGLFGEMFTTKTGEKTLNVASWTMLSKSLRPLPEKFHGISDREQILRKRYLDLISSPASVARFKTRSAITAFLRSYLDSHGFLEIDTPVLTNKASGAIATPFVTRHNALDFDVHLRIAPETYLKRAVAGGFDRVYEMARCFRNEGMDRSHLPDFTMLEFYAAYWNFEDNMIFTEALVKDLVREIIGDESIEYQGQTIRFSGDWPRYSFRELLLRDSGIDIAKADTKTKLLDALKRENLDLESGPETDRASYGNLIDALYKKVSRPNLIDPTFLVEHPIEISPLARRNVDRPGTADRFQLVVNGWEVINAYSELIDPVEQRSRLQAQAESRAAGDDQAMELDVDFITAMEHGMPPMSGWGMGVDRIVALLTNSESLRDVVLFPLMKPE